MPALTVANAVGPYAVSINVFGTTLNVSFPGLKQAAGISLQEGIEKYILLVPVCLLPLDAN
jgi:hypothetical protein